MNHEGPATVIGSVLSGSRGKYRLTGYLDKGGFGSVFVAEDDAQNVVAVKVIESVRGPEALLSFEKETKAVDGLSHPNLLRMIDNGTFFDQSRQLLFVVSEFCPDGNLRSRYSGQGLTDTVVRNFQQLLSGLTHLHTRAIHRDLKPENVLIAGTVLKIGDFGLSRLVAASTQAATFKGYGAPHYMAPEVWEENTPTKATDLYAVGIMLFEALTGQLPFEGQDWLALRRQHLHEQPPRVRSLNIGVSGQLDGVVRRLLEKDPLRRFQSASEVSDALIGSPPPTFSEPYCYSNEDPSRWGRSSDISYRAAER